MNLSEDQPKPTDQPLDFSIQVPAIGRQQPPSYDEANDKRLWIYDKFVSYIQLDVSLNKNRNHIIYNHKIMYYNIIKKKRH